MKCLCQFSFSCVCGGMLVMMMLVMLVLLVMLGLVEIGYLFWVKCDVQKVVDFVVLVGVQWLELCSLDNSDNSVVWQNVLVQNRFVGILQICCGNWSVSCGIGICFVISVDVSNLCNVVQVIVECSVLFFFGQIFSLFIVSVQVVVCCVEFIVVFVVGLQLLWINGDLVLLLILCLVGLDVINVMVLFYDGLVQVNVILFGLLKVFNILVSVNFSVVDFNCLLLVNKILLV